MNSETERMKIDDCLSGLEDLCLEMEFLAAIAQTCGAAFEDEKSLSIISNIDIQGSFYGINRKIIDMEEELSKIIRTLMSCDMSDQDENS